MKQGSTEDEYMHTFTHSCESLKHHLDMHILFNWRYINWIWPFTTHSFMVTCLRVRSGDINLFCLNSNLE
jgi:hypothetical protein